MSGPMSRDDVKARVCEAIDRRRDRVVALAEDILRHPELGYKEHRTADLVARVLGELGLRVETGLARTGVKAVLNGGSAGPGVAILGELDALPVPGHPHADPQTGAAHACGHFAQVGMLLAAAIGLVEAGAAAHLDGRVVFMAVPAEESVEVEWRLALREAGEIEFLGGKQELIRLGAFDDVDLAMLTHSSGASGPARLGCGGTNNGHLNKQAQFIGRAAHAGAAPHRGINALKAATLAIAAIDAHREAFRDEDFVRVHPIITKGGDVVNAVPADVRLETHVRANTVEAMQDASRKVDLALRGGALAMGARVRITTMPGYLPLVHEPRLVDLYRANARVVVGSGGVSEGGHVAATTDMGDLSQVLPVIQPRCGGGEGTPHGPEFKVTDYDVGLVEPAKAMALTVIDLLADGAGPAREIREQCRPRLTKAAYLALVRGMVSVEEFGGAAEPQ